MKIIQQKKVEKDAAKSSNISLILNKLILFFLIMLVFVFIFWFIGLNISPPDEPSFTPNTTPAITQTSIPSFTTPHNISSTTLYDNHNNKTHQNIPDVPFIDKDSIGVSNDIYQKQYRLWLMNFQRAINYDNDRITQSTFEITGKSSDYNLKDICDVFDYVNVKWNYRIEPGEFFSTASQTINESYEGDCDDYSIVISSLFENMGFNTRIVVANDASLNGNGYPEVYIGTNTDNLDEILAYIKTRYGVEYIYYRERKVDFETQYWLNLDWSGTEGKLHLGGYFFEGLYGNRIIFYPKGLVEFVSY